MSHIAPIEPWGFLTVYKERGDTCEALSRGLSDSMATYSSGRGAGVTESSAAGWRQRGVGHPARSLALPVAAARGSRHRGRMR